jgi:HlyD family secretion protein
MGARMKKRWIWIGLAAVVVVGLVAVNVARQQAGKVTAVQYGRVRVEDVTSRVRAPGKIEPKTQVKISADIPGKVVRLLVQEGDAVRRGALMLQIDDTQYRASYDQARAMQASAQARQREAEKALAINAANFERQRALYERKLLSQAEWDEATRVNESARVSAATAVEEVSRLRASVAAAQDNLSKCRFEAPFDGIVSALNVEQGEIVITGTMNNPGTQIMTVSDLSRMLVRADVDETDVVDMKIGQKARISVDAFPDTTFPGTVTEIGNTAKRSITSAVEGQTNFEVKVVFDQNVPEVRPGMTADVEIETATHVKTTAVPIQAVVVRTERELERAAQRGTRAERRPRRRDAIAAEDDTVGRKDKEITGVFVVKNGTATFVPVKTGIASESAIEIHGDAKEGDTIVAGPYKALRELKPGSKVKQEQGGTRGGSR